MPWGGHAAIWAIPQLYRADQAQPHHAGVHQHPLPRRVHLPGAVGRQRRQSADRASTTARCRRRRGARSKGRWRAASCARWSPPPASTSGSTGATSTAWCRWARPRARAACCSGSAAPTTGSTSPSRAILVPGNRFEFLEAQAAKDAVDQGQRDGEDFRPGGLDVLAQHVMACACAAPFDEDALLAEVRSSLAYAWVDEAVWQRVLTFVATGGYALKAYDKFKRIVRDAGRDLAPDPSRARPAPPDERRDHRRFGDDRDPLPQRPLARQGRGAVRRLAARPATPSASPAWTSRSKRSAIST